MNKKSLKAKVKMKPSFEFETFFWKKFDKEFSHEKKTDYFKFIGVVAASIIFVFIIFENKSLKPLSFDEQLISFLRLDANIDELTTADYFTYEAYDFTIDAGQED